MRVLAKKIGTNKATINLRLKGILLSIVLREVVKKNRLKYLVRNQERKPFFSKRRLRITGKNRRRSKLHAGDVIAIARTKTVKREHKSKKSKRLQDQSLLPGRNRAIREGEVTHRRIRKRKRQFKSRT